MKRYTVKQLGTISGVSVRTLHHYDDIGLLKPAWVGENGYRYYQREQLLRLQQVLFFRELGLPLAKIAALLDQPDFDRVASLRAHRQQLEAGIERRRKLLATLDRTVSELEGETMVADKALFDGFTPERQLAHETDLALRYGEPMRDLVARANARVKSWSKADHQRNRADYAAIEADIAAAMDRGARTDARDVQAIIARHHAWLCRYWRPDARSYAGLGALYVEHPDFAARYDGRRAGMAAFLAQAMAVFAERRLAEPAS